MIVTIYTLKDPITKEIKYIGRTKNNLKARLRGHLSRAKRNIFKTKKDYWLLNLCSLNSKPLIETLLTIEGWEESYKIEQQLIEKYIKDGYFLLNLHDKGPGHLRNITKEQKIKISETVKRLHKEGVYDSRGIPLTIYDLNGNKIKTFKNARETANFIGVSLKHLENSIKRNDKRVKLYQVRKENKEKIEQYPYFWKNRVPTINSVNCLETPEEGNQQPSSCGDTEKGSTTSSESHVDNNSTTKAGHQYHNLTKVCLQTNFSSNSDLMKI